MKMNVGEAHSSSKLGFLVAPIPNLPVSPTSYAVGLDNKTPFH